MDEKLNLLVDDTTIEDVGNNATFVVSAFRLGTDQTVFCDLPTELADAGHGLQVKINDESVRVFELEYLEPGKLRVLYVYFDDGPKKEAQTESYLVTEDLSFSTNFLVWYQEWQSMHRLYALDFDEETEDAFDYYRRVFIPRMQAARRNGEIPGLIY